MYESGTLLYCPAFDLQGDNAFCIILFITSLERVPSSMCVFVLMFDTLWVELSFSDVINKLFIYSRFMFRNGFPWFLAYAEVLINICHMCYTSRICANCDKCAQTLQSECQNMMKWVEPGFENQHTQRKRIGDSCLLIYFRR